MKKNKIFVVLFVILLSFLIVLPALAGEDAYGSAGAAKTSDSELNLSKMLIFAIQDEYLARGEYQKIMEKFGKRRPFSNIIKAEEMHIAWLKPLLNKYGIEVPSDCGSELAAVPATFAEALQIGAAAEVANIAMYERFLKKDIPGDVKSVFERLLAASQNHLASFQAGGKNYR